jgi:hypothetical protein
MYTVYFYPPLTFCELEEIHMLEHKPNFTHSFPGPYPGPVGWGVQAVRRPGAHVLQVCRLRDRILGGLDVSAERRVATLPADSVIRIPERDRDSFPLR